MKIIILTQKKLLKTWNIRCQMCGKIIGKYNKTTRGFVAIRCKSCKAINQFNFVE